MDELFGFLDPIIEKEEAFLKTQYNMTDEGAKSASDLLKKRLIRALPPPDQ